MVDYDTVKIGNVVYVNDTQGIIKVCKIIGKHMRFGNIAYLKLQILYGLTSNNTRIDDIFHVFPMESNKCFYTVEEARKNMEGE